MHENVQQPSSPTLGKFPNEPSSVFDETVTVKKTPPSERKEGSPTPIVMESMLYGLLKSMIGKRKAAYCVGILSLLVGIFYVCMEAYKTWTG